MSVEIVEEVNKAEFNGKTEIKALKTVTKNVVEDRPVIKNNTFKAENKIPRKQTINNEIVSNNDTDEWESF